MRSPGAKYDGGGLVERVRSLPPVIGLYRLLPGRVRIWIARIYNAHRRRQLQFKRTPSWHHPLPAAHGSECTPPRSGRGINIFGFLRGQFGLGESARQYARALIVAGIDVSLVDLDLDLPHGWEDETLLGMLRTDAPYPVSIIFVNPDYLDIALKRIGTERLQNRYLIACWFWELETIPSSWVKAIDSVDAIMVASRFIEEAFAAATPKPIFRVPLPLTSLPDSGLHRSDFGLSGEEFVFLTSFDFNSWVARKNPGGVIDAFQRAFPDRGEGVRLLIKTSNGFRYPSELNSLVAAARSDKRIIIRDDLIPRSHMTSLLRCCDAYVSLHRAEGFGLGMAEAMSLGKPVVATAWSGNLDFMSEDVAHLVEFKLVPVARGQYLDAGEARWADPDIGSAARAMRRLVSDPAGASALGARAQAHVRNLLSPENSSSIIIRRVDEILVASSSRAAS